MAMARFRGARYLTCFYCGKRSGLRYDGATRDFLCLHCDATNYLDENGEITDPPVATDGEATATQYAASTAPAPAPTNSIFCQTCLKNQHLFAKSLAQYFPDDPADPEYAQLERNYYRYRRGLEKRYPQVCDECADKAEDRIRQAGYTAKTDHLRRMMNLSRGRKATRKRTVLDWASSLGKTTWRLGFVLQMLWHLVTVARVLHNVDDGMRDPDDASAPLAWLAWLMERTTALLPAADGLIRWSITAALMSAWWNPHFVQVNRGFTRHLLGLTQWYSFQGLIVFFRLVFRGVLGINGGQSQSTHAQVSAHVAMAAVMILVYVLATKSIRVDTSPLFATGDQPMFPRGTKSPAERKRKGPKTFSDIFNDALEPANGTPQRPQPLGLMPSPQPAYSPPWPQTNSELSLGNLGLSDTPMRRSRQVQYDEEMDWSPIPPQHRALKIQPSPSRGSAATVGKGPTGADCSNPFWYKVPAAPVNPAQRLRNPPRAPDPKQARFEVNTVVFTGRRREGTDGKESGEGGCGVEFRQPQFFAPEKDDASTLADLLNQSFSLSQEQDQEEEDSVQDFKGRNQGQSRTMSGHRGSNRASVRSTRAAGPVILAALLAAWLLTLLVAIPGRPECRTAMMAVAGVVALRGSGDTSDSVQRSPGRPGPSAYLLSALGIAELAAVCWVGSEVWKGETTEVGWYGTGVLATMLGHQVLETCRTRA